jgi:hypothetical protein
MMYVSRMTSVGWMIENDDIRANNLCEHYNIVTIGNAGSEGLWGL